MRGHEIKKKVEYFLEDKKVIHISLKSGRFYNGYVVEIRTDFMIFNDKVLGELPVWFDEIKEDGIEPFKEDWR